MQIPTTTNFVDDAVSNLKAKKSAETRRKIVRAFENCVARNGYAQTKLVDIAEDAGLATPHLRYYFKNKESILEYQYEQLVAAFEQAVLAIEAEDPIAWFEALGHLIFNTGRRRTQAFLVLIEANTLIARSPHMREVKERYDVQTRAAIEVRARQLGCEDPPAAAVMIFHFLTGLMLNSAFDGREERAAAIPFFLRFVAALSEERRASPQG